MLAAAVAAIQLRMLDGARRAKIIGENENDGILVVDGVPKFSLASGHIRDGGNNMSGLSSVTNDG